LWYVEWMLTDAEMAGRYIKIRPCLDERQRRLWPGVEAQALGRAGVGVVARATGSDLKTVRKGGNQVGAGLEPDGRVRGPGGGRPSVTGLGAGALPALEALVDPETRGDPVSPLRWTTKSAVHLAGGLTRQGHAVTARTVARLLAGAGYSLQGNAKTVEGKQHPDRDAQFRYINARVTAFQDDGSPVISVDAKKKENVGNFKNGGAEWAPAGQPERVSVHDFADEEPGKAVPCGICDLTANAGWGQRRHRPRHRRVRRRLDPVLVARARPGRQPRSPAPADHGGLRRVRWLPAAAAENRAGRVRRRGRPGHHRGAPATGNQQMEQN